MFSKDITKIENKVFKIVNIYEGQEEIQKSKEEIEYMYV